MNEKFACHGKVCDEYDSCKIRKPIGLACILSGLGIEMEECWNYQNDNKIIEIKSYTVACDTRKCKKKKLVYKLVKKCDKLMKLRIVWCKDWKKCYDEYYEAMKKN